MAVMLAGSQPSVVLVHGAWHGAWCWQRVEAALQSRGIAALAVDLPGRGASAEPLGDLPADVAFLSAVLGSLAGPVIVVGHSYGGAVITGAGRHPAVSHLVYLSALALDEGESCASAASAEASSAGISHAGRPDLGSGFVPGPDGSITVDRDVARACFYQDCDDQTAEWALDRLGPQLLAGLQQSPREVAWRFTPSSYLVCASDMAVHPDVQRILARRCGSSRELPAGHSSFLSRPDLVAGAVAEISPASRR
jgi:pimeloyl-ACP methyl ester carboxylesterase